MVSRGRHFVTAEEVAELVDVERSSVPASLQRSREAGTLVSPTKGAWIPVPAEFRTWGAPPASHYIDALMRHLGHPYYVGFLSAAEVHGSSHQSPMVFQVVTPALLRHRQIGRSKIQFIQRSLTAERRTERRNVPTGRLNVSAPEVTVLDLVEAPAFGGGLSNVATVIGELLDEGKLDTTAMASDARVYPMSVAQRVGYLLDFMADATGVEVDTQPLLRLVANAAVTELDPHEPATGTRDDRWRLVANAPIEPDR